MAEFQINLENNFNTVNDSSSDLFTQEENSQTEEMIGSFQQDAQDIQDEKQDNKQLGEKKKLTHTPNKEENKEGIVVHSNKEVPVIIGLMKNNTKHEIEEHTVSQEDTQILLKEFAEDSMEIEINSSFSEKYPQTKNDSKTTLGAISKRPKTEKKEKLGDVISRLDNFKKIRAIVLQEQQRVLRQRNENENETDTWKKQRVVNSLATRKSNLDQIESIVTSEIKTANFAKQVIDKGSEENKAKLEQNLFDLGCRKNNFVKIVSMAKEELKKIAQEEQSITKDFLSLTK